MDEKEIERFLLNRGPSISTGIFSTLPSAIVEEYGSDIAYGVTEGLKVAARAIAEGMRKGVVWEAKGRADTWVGPMTGLTYLEIVLDDIGTLFSKPVELRVPINDRQCVRVTVRLEGEDAEKGCVEAL